MTSIQLDHVTVVRDKAELITDISLTIPSAEFLVVIGPSGSGKTTLLRAIAGLDKPANGTVLYDGQPVNDLRASERDIAMVFQDNALIPFKTIRQNVAFPLELHNVGRQEIADRVMAESRVMAIDRFLSRMPGELAEGQKQLVQAARTLVRRPNAFLLDEPLARVDPVQRKALMDDSLVRGIYDEAVDRVSAYEILEQRAQQSAAAQAAPVPNLDDLLQKRPPSRGRSRQTSVEAFATSAMRSLGTQIGRQLVRGIMGSLFGGRRR